MGSTKKIRVSLLDRVRFIISWALSARTQTKVWGAVLIALAVAWSTYLLGPRPSTGGNAALLSTTLPASLATSELTAADSGVTASLAASRIRFPDWQQLIKTPKDDVTRQSLVENYRGETVTWEGYFDEVNEVSATKGGSESQRFILAMYESESVRNSKDLGRAPALCWLSESARNHVADLKPGQKLIIKGTLAAPETVHGTLLGTRVYNCEILRR